MGPLAAVRQFFSAQVESAPVDDRFIQIDRDELAKRLDLAAKGRESGAAEQPPSDGGTSDPVEHDILNAMADYHERARIEAHNNIRSYDSRLASLGLLDKLATVRSSAESAMADFRTETVITKQRLTLSRDAIAASYNELKSFQRAQNLQRPAHRALPAIATGGAIFLSWFLEAAANSVLLRINDDLGLLGGFIAALVIAALNVGVSVAIGRLVWPWAHHRDAVRRSLAIAGIIFWVVALVAWNLLAAHYRDAKAGGLLSPESQALVLWRTEPFALDTFYSWGLFIAGLLAGFFAALASYKRDDPYPGYGALYRRHEDRCADYATGIEDAREVLESTRDDAIQRATDIRTELARQFRERGRILAARASFVKRFAEHEAYLEQTGNALLVTYRAANRAARTTPPPANFSERWSLGRTELPPDVSNFLTEAEIAAVDSDLDATSRAINHAYIQAVESFEPLEQLKKQLAHGDT